jgi:hypothetical protein
VCTCKQALYYDADGSANCLRTYFGVAQSPSRNQACGSLHRRVGLLSSEAANVLEKKVKVS